MREILFRGKSALLNKWIYGDLIKLPNGNCFIVEAGPNLAMSMEYSVDPHTLCQFSEVYDRNGKRIFEGDIVKLPWRRSYEKDRYMKGVVEFHGSAFSVLYEDENYGRNFLAYLDDVEVIGNVYDNPGMIS